MKSVLNAEAPSSPGPAGLRVGYVGALLGRQALGQWGSGFVLELARSPGVDRVDVFCPRADGGEGASPLTYPPKVRVHSVFELDNPTTLLGLLRALRGWRGDLLIFNSNTTAYGRGTLANVGGLALPALARRLLGCPTVLVYHSSVLTSDVAQLGYSGAFDRLRAAVAARAERWLFHRVPTFLLLECYCDAIRRRFPGLQVYYFENEYLEAVPTILLNHLDQAESGTGRPMPDPDGPTVLLHGFWGPQKDLEGALATLRRSRQQGQRFRLVLTGSTNPHFPRYAATLDRLCAEYSEIITRRDSDPSETEIATLMQGSDLLLLPYRASGGQSGVMEIASAFDLPTIAIDFPEYREKARTKPSVLLVAPGQWGEAVDRWLSTPPPRSPQPLRQKLDRAQELVQRFIDAARSVA